MRTLRLILGDQLNHKHSWFKNVSSEIVYLMMEVRSETDYCVHHIQKVLAFFKSMSCFAQELRSAGHRVHYIKINDVDNKQSFAANIIDAIEKFAIQKFEYLLPDEYRLDVELKKIAQQISIPTSATDTEHFYTTRYELQEIFPNKRKYLMENFYRHMRKKHRILMQDDKPMGGIWNFDKENRKKLHNEMVVPPPLMFDNEVTDEYTRISDAGIKTIGEVDTKHFIWPVTRRQSLQLLDYFCSYLLPYFGTYQDTMTMNSWSVYHSRLSFALNVKLISPQEVIEAVLHAARDRKHQISLAQVEGFVRQILGWREFMRGIYWAHMPQYADLNFFEHYRPLPQWYWNAQTHMNCMQHAIRQSLHYAYAHHIQRLMLTGNFALLAGVNPTETDAWYLGIYIDAIEWVEITNTRGMSQYADGGLLATKPYVSSANYIDNMSNYCKSCIYNVKRKSGDKACPFNSLYWHFFHRHRERLQSNPRVGMMYKIWDAINTEEQNTILQQAEHYLNNIEHL